MEGTLRVEETCGVSSSSFFSSNWVAAGSCGSLSLLPSQESALCPLALQVTLSEKPSLAALFKMTARSSHSL